MVNNKRKNSKVIDTRITWSGPKAEEFLKIVKEEYGIPLPYGAVRQLIRLACAKYVEIRRQEVNNYERTSTK